ncbi:MAG: hypothetical protein ACYCQI_16775, partial [Gammaproteobacteria bacterium]
MSNIPVLDKILRTKIKYKVINFIYPYLLTTFPLLIFAACILFFKLYGEISKTKLILWLLAIFILAIGQLILAIWFQRTKYSLKWEHLYFKLLLVNTALIGGL